MSEEFVSPIIAKLFREADKAIDLFEKMPQAGRVVAGATMRTMMDPLMLLFLSGVGKDVGTDMRVRRMLPVFMEMSMYGMISKKLVKRLINKLYEVKQLEEQKQKLLEGGE